MDDIVDRLNGRYSVGPHLPNGDPEFGWRQFQATPVNMEAACIIEGLRMALQWVTDDKKLRHPKTHRDNAIIDVCERALALGRAAKREDTFMQEFNQPRRVAVEQCGVEIPAEVACPEQQK